MLRQKRLIAVVGLVGWLLADASAAAATEPAARLGYNSDIRPILAEHCFACHGPDSASRKADLRLDQREIAVEMGAIRPGDPQGSELIRRILSTDPHEVMPPPETKKSLTAAQKELLARWIAEEAEYELHWSFIPPQRPQPPAAAAGWVRNPIDAFVLAKLEAAGLSPAPEADRATLARRAALDLTGLPPTPQQVQAFVADPAPDAYERYLDELLRSPHWGEHRGRYWLDYARYADTHGIHFDNYREMWSYRDWVIRAFNDNMRWDDFTIESLAGDLLPDRTLEQQIGSGFNRCNMTTNEGGIIDEEYLVLYARDRTETTAQVWLGLTAGCAVCHSHKFDPLSQQEFYELAAFFNNTTQAAKDGNIKDTPPIIVVPQPEDRARFAELTPLLASAREKVEERRKGARTEYDAWFAAATPDLLADKTPRDHLHLHAALDEGEGRAVSVQVDGAERAVELAESASWQEGPAGQALQVQGRAAGLEDVGRFEQRQPFSCAAWIKVAGNDGNGAICARMDREDNYRGWDFWTQRRTVGMHIINAWPGNGLKVVTKKQVPANKWTHVAVTYDGSSRAAGVKVYIDGVAEPLNVENDKLSGAIATDVPFLIGQRSTGEQFSGGLQDLRIYGRELTASEVEAIAKVSRFTRILSRPADKRTDEQRNELYGFWLGAFDEAFQRLSEVVAVLEREEAEIKNRGTIAHVMNEKPSPAMAFVLNRGEYDQRREEVRPNTPAVFPPFPEHLPRNRLGFAQWLLLPEHPVTSRVTVNRFWQEVFGAGLVRTAGDFGIMGELPSHPELLDWLAVEFRESGWDVQRLFKLMLTSATYRQSAAVTPEKLERDPSNRLLSRGPRFRMDAEMVRDYALAASGLLAPRVGGPSVKPYQPEGVWEAIAMNVSNTRAYERGSGEDLYRRSLYWFWKRMAPPASMDIFNAPNREYCVVRRERTNTPLQALVTLNDVQFVEAARRLAERTLREGGASFESRVGYLGLRLLGREFRPPEVEIIRRSLDRLSAYYAAHPAAAGELLAVGESPVDAELPPVELAAWTMLSNQLLNLDEVLNK